MSAEIIPSAEELNKHAQNRIENEVVARFNLENITHARLGGYNARVTSAEIDFNETIRTTNIKGIWRWWLRATLTGAYCELGNNAKTEYIVKTTRRILGSNKTQSDLKIAISPQGIEQPKPFVTKDRIQTKFNARSGRNEAKLSNLGKDVPPRLILLLEELNAREQNHHQSEEELKIQAEEISKLYPPGSIKAQLSIYNRGLTNAEVNVGIASLLLALVLGGLGSLTRRGFGHFRMSEFTSRLSSLGSVQGMLNEIQKPDSDAISRGLDQLRNFALGAAKEIVEKDEHGSLRKESLPKSACLCAEHFLHDIAVIKAKPGHENSKDLTDNSKKLLCVLGRSTMKSSWKLIDPSIEEKDVNRKLSPNDIQYHRKVPLRNNSRIYVLGEKYKTWVLGIPRFSENLNTGYIAQNEKENQIARRPSAISMAPVSFDTHGNAFAIIYGFKSSDWPSKVLYFPGGKRKGQRYEEQVKVPECFEQAMDWILKYLNGVQMD